MGPFAGAHDTTATYKMATVITQIAIDGSQNDTTHFSGYESDITRANNSTDISRLLRSDSWEFEPQSNSVDSATAGILGNATVLFVEEDFWQERLPEPLFTYISPFLIIIGTLGNAVSIITLQHRHFRSTSTGFILTALSAVDIAALDVSLMSHWLLAAFKVRFENLSSFGCKFSCFLAYYLHTLASWTLILLTVERGISVWYPFRCKELCSKRRIVITWTIIALLLFAENSLFFRAYDLHPMIMHLDDNNMSTIGYSCSPMDGYWSHFFYHKWQIVDAVFADFFPFLIIMTGNILIIIRILKSQCERKAQIGAASTSKPMTSTTAKLIGLSAMFLILNCPYDVIHILCFNIGWDSLQKKERAIYDLALCISILSYNANNAFEFIVYFVGGRKFREAFLETFLPYRKANNQNGQRTIERRNINAGTMLHQL